MKIIIVGCGKVGSKIAEMLSRENEHDITVIDLRSQVVSDVANKLDIMGLTGSGANLENLIEAGVEDADILIAVTGSDELNLLTCLMAKKAGNCQTIARVRKPEYSKSIGLLKDDLGLAMIINPEFAAANEMARALRFPSAIHIDTFAKGRVEILKFRITENSVMDNLKVCDISTKLKSDILVCGVEREDEAFIPDGNFVMKAGDMISIITSTTGAGQFFQTIGVKTNRVRDCMIAGGGDTAYYLAYVLLKSGIKVKIVEKDEKRCEELCQLLPKADIIHGDATDNQLLSEEGLEQAESFVSLTNLDEENVLLSLYAKSKKVGKIVTKINRIAYDKVIGEMDLGTIIYPKNITAEYIVRFVRAKNNSIGSNIETIHLILDGKAEAIEFVIKANTDVVGKPLSSINIKENTLIACIHRNGKVIIPRGHDTMETGDTVIVVTSNTGYEDINDILA
ncbi:MAG: Trk system potassium transporter TrkA [Clostridia bacterium]|nr:Trk system potassium transporter TrkA [Clostridia bacterium]